MRRSFEFSVYRHTHPWKPVFLIFSFPQYIEIIVVATDFDILLWNLCKNNLKSEASYIILLSFSVGVKMPDVFFSEN